MSNKNCLNCARSAWIEDVKTKRIRRRCAPNAIWVNRKMCCEEWKDEKDRTTFVGAVSVSGMTTEKKR